MSTWEDDDELDEEEGDWSSDDSDDDGTAPCPHCGRDYFEDSPRCPHCGNYISREDAPQSPKPWWFTFGAIIALIAAGTWLFTICRG